jgi:hypothetical protein
LAARACSNFARAYYNEYFPKKQKKHLYFLAPKFSEQGFFLPRMREAAPTGRRAIKRRL